MYMLRQFIYPQIYQVRMLEVDIKDYDSGGSQESGEPGSHEN